MIDFYSFMPLIDDKCFRICLKYLERQITISRKYYDHSKDCFLKGAIWSSLCIIQLINLYSFVFYYYLLNLMKEDLIDACVPIFLSTIKAQIS